MFETALYTEILLFSNVQRDFTDFRRTSGVHFDTVCMVEMISIWFCVTCNKKTTTDFTISMFRK